MAVQINLKEVERVERSKGVDFYEFCIDLVGNDTTTRMRPIDRGDMQARCAARSAEIGRDWPRCTARLSEIGARSLQDPPEITSPPSQAWLGVLQTQLSAFTQRTNKGSMITTLHQATISANISAIISATRGR